MAAFALKYSLPREENFNMGDRSSLSAVRNWPQRMADWLSDSGYLKPTGAPRKPAD